MRTAAYYRLITHNSLKQVMSQIEESIIISAPPAQVWTVLMDLKSWPQWNTFVTSIEVQPPHTQFSVGSKQTITLNNSQTYTNTTSVVNPGKEFCWNGSILTPALFDTEHRGRGRLDTVFTGRAILWDIGAYHRSDREVGGVEGGLCQNEPRLEEGG